MIGKNKLGFGGASCLAPALRSLRNLTELDVSYNQLGPQGASSLSLAIGSLSSLERLEIRGNHLGDSGPSVLAPAVKGLSCLTHLDIVHISAARLDKKNELLEAVMQLPAFKLEGQTAIGACSAE
jgi:Ran GTPase-activating protein (RanGAP) involved in mRNA processing and transport